LLSQAEVAVSKFSPSCRSSCVRQQPTDAVQGAIPTQPRNALVALPEAVDAFCSRQKKTAPKRRFFVQ